MKPTTYISIAFILILIAFLLAYKPERKLAGALCVDQTHLYTEYVPIFDTPTGELGIGQYSKYLDGFLVHFPSFTSPTTSQTYPDYISFLTELPKTKFEEVKQIDLKFREYFTDGYQETDTSVKGKDIPVPTCDPTKPLKEIIK